MNVILVKYVKRMSDYEILLIFLQIFNYDDFLYIIYIIDLL